MLKNLSISELKKFEYKPVFSDKLGVFECKWVWWFFYVTTIFNGLTI